jgi:hypothetical protein
MKTRFLLLLLFIVSYSFSQSVNDYKAVIIPLKYDFLKTENQYRLSTLTKSNLKKAGFEAFYNNESIPSEYNDRCSLLYIDVVKESTFLMTKLYAALKDCNGKIIFQSEVGKSKEKDYEVAYSEALNNAFVCIYALKYKYNGKSSVNAPADAKAIVNAAPIPVVAAPVAASVNNVGNTVIIENTDSVLLYAQPTATGFQLVDSTPKVVFKVFKTSSPVCYIAAKGSVQGVLISKDNQWYFEYYQNDKLVSEKVAVKF